MKKLHDTRGRAVIALAPKSGIRREQVVFETPPVTRVCNASMREKYVTPNWPSARVSAADGIQTKGQMC